jgi:hypothetical protein
MEIFCTIESSTTSDPSPSHVSIYQMDHKLHKCIMNSPFILVHIKRYRLIVYVALRNISVYSMIKQLTDVIKRTTYALDS